MLAAIEKRCGSGFIVRFSGSDRDGDRAVGGSTLGKKSSIGFLMTEGIGKK